MLGFKRAAELYDITAQIELARGKETRFGSFFGLVDKMRRYSPPAGTAM